MPIVIEQEQYTVFPTGDYKARITEIDEDEGLYGPQVKFEFTISGGEFDGESLLGWCSAKFSAKSKLYQWTRAAFGADIPEDYPFNSDDLLNRKVALTVIIMQKDDGSEFNRIEGVRGSNSAGPTPAPQPVAPTITGTATGTGYPPQPESPPTSDDDIPF